LSELTDNQKMGDTGNVTYEKVKADFHTPHRGTYQGLTSSFEPGQRYDLVVVEGEGRFRVTYHQVQALKSTSSENRVWFNLDLPVVATWVKIDAL
jgi:phosphoribosylformylglycinamidine (FGAM) synthase-like amidotransferase family enzyme